MPAQRTLMSFTLAAITAAAAAWVLPAAAQTQGSPAAPAAGSASSFTSGSNRGYLGLTVGRSDYRMGCSATTLSCDDSSSSIHIYTGTPRGNFWGAELGYINMGRATRAGSRAKAEGMNVSLVGRASIANSFRVFGKLGTTYGHTDTSSALGSGMATGSESGFGLSYGAGVSFDFTPKLSATLGWDSHDFRFPGGARDPVRATSLGLQYRY